MVKLIGLKTYIQELKSVLCQVRNSIPKHEQLQERSTYVGLMERSGSLVTQTLSLHHASGILVHGLIPGWTWSGM